MCVTDEHDLNSMRVGYTAGFTGQHELTGSCHKEKYVWGLWVVNSTKLI